MLPLEGIVVVAVEQAVAAPICTRHLGDLGARVVKVENRRGGDFARDYDTAVGGMAAHFVWANRNKESVALDLKHERGRAVLARLVERADVLVQNLAPGAAARLGLDAAELRVRHPRLITVDISGYGRGGPYARARAYDLLVQSEAGSCAITGTPGRPAKPGIPIADIGAGMYALSSVLAALFVRERTGAGTAISVGLFDAVAEWMGFALNQARYGGFDVEPNGLGSPMVAPYGAYGTADGQVLVLGTTNDREWRRLARQVLERPDLAEDPRYASNSDRVARRAELDAVIGAWAAGLPLERCRRAAEAAGLGHARLNTPTEVLGHPQLVERGRWRQVASPVGPVACLLPPPESADWDWRLDPVPALGEHTEPVLAELGFDAGELTALRAEGVIGPADVPRPGGAARQDGSR
ncbi:Crotonobetainyl-CoA:carnitine CoA-transferase CaiB [Thermomonospora echinospora]|uniref:Crotonobetainyl-CoA:carnitine CoA-transferase CaiB n=1 Tax=Thermomonospora echinospora TaxID=1992 RepID=A0A1H5T792_9ACTN|nr:CaiB/BaiF CoA-transferase family protein [Thermomonospora echinospora]SEF58666.1 Crotonobetainyl-CoA:carnitine CoA-transferase CaiB [Thermomonospora echinospora]